MGIFFKVFVFQSISFLSLCFFCFCCFCAFGVCLCFYLFVCFFCFSVFVTIVAFIIRSGWLLQGAGAGPSPPTTLHRTNNLDMYKICAMPSQADPSLLPIVLPLLQLGWHPKQACPLQLLKAPRLFFSGAA